jgi:CheY-like chemotaxis protein
MNTCDSKTILVADDNPQDVEMTLMALARTKLPHRTVVACDGEEALDYLFCRGNFQGRSRRHPDLVLLDINMPRINGTQVLSEVKRDARLKMIPVVMLTSSREESDVAACYGLGANAYVVKPVDFSEFLDVITKTGAFWAGLNEPLPIRSSTLEDHHFPERVVA